MFRKRFAVLLHAIVGALALCVAPAWAQKEKEKHEHPEHGPHKGMLIELGDHEYHAELVHDDAKNSLTIYLLDGKVKDAVGSEAKEAFVNVRVGRRAKQFKLPAHPEKTDRKGTTSRFAVVSKELGELLDKHDADCRLRVTIAGKSYTAKIEHDHDHDEKKKK